MRKPLLLLFALIFISGCSQCKAPKGDVLARINNYEITKAEFEEAFKESDYGRTDTLESRKEFLNNLVNRKLILQDAQQEGLDKDPMFLRMIEKFWEQSLLKLALDKKTKEIAASAFVSDKVIEETYNKMIQEGKTEKPYDKMYKQIKWELLKDQETNAINEWIAQMHAKAYIEVNYNLLPKNK